MDNRLMRPGVSRYAPWLSGGIPSEHCIAAWHGIGAASYEASKVNLANPGTYNLTTVSGKDPGWSVEGGWSNNGSDKFFMTGVVPGNNTTMIVRFANWADSGDYSAGSFAGVYQSNVARFALDRGYPSNGCVRFYVGNWGTVYREIVGERTEGTVAIAGRLCCVNGAYGNIVPDSPYSLTYPINLMCRNNNTATGATATAWMKGNLLAAWIYDIPLGLDTIAVLHTAMMALPIKAGGATVYQGAQTVRDISYPSSLGD